MACDDDVKSRDSSLPVVCGVYFLFQQGTLEYVGQSRDCHHRIATHRANGREFDMATVMPLRAEFLTDVENALIKAYAPRKNVQQKPVAERLNWNSLLPPVKKAEREPVKPSALGTVSRARAREMASYYGLPQSVIAQAEADGRLRFVPGPRTSKGGHTTMVAMHSVVEVFCEAEKARTLAAMGLV